MLLIFPLYIGIFVIIFLIIFSNNFLIFFLIIKAMTNINETFADLNTPEIDKLEFLVEKVKNGESISNSKTIWTEKRLQEASDKVIEKLYEKYPPPIEINKQQALVLGKPICPVVIDMYAKGLKNILNQVPYVRGKYTINVAKLKHNISNNEIFCNNLAIEIGSKMIEQMGNNTPAKMGFYLTSMTWDAIEEVEVSENNVIENDLTFPVI